MNDSKHRFSDRVDDYKKHRPSYPPQVATFIRRHLNPDTTWNIADIGSGTGISTRMLIHELQCPVFAVEPNEKMRSAAEESGKENPLFHSMNGCAEVTTLPDASINLVCAFQSFHWFDRTRAREEFQRILKDPKWVILVWNDRVTKGDAFLQEYDSLLRELPQYVTSTHKSISIEDIASFLGTTEIIQENRPNIQRLDWEGIQGRFSSSSYTPKHGTPEFIRVVGRLKEIFDKYNINGVVDFKYDLQIYLGRICSKTKLMG